MIRRSLVSPTSQEQQDVLIGEEIRQVPGGKQIKMPQVEDDSQPSSQLPPYAIAALIASVSLVALSPLALNQGSVTSRQTRQEESYPIEGIPWSTSNGQQLEDISRLVLVRLLSILVNQLQLLWRVLLDSYYNIQCSAKRAAAVLKLLSKTGATGSSDLFCLDEASPDRRV